MLASRGARGFIDLGKEFVLMDKTASGTIGLTEFKTALSDHQINLSEPEILTIFTLFDASKTGKFRFDEFLKVIRGRMGENRKLLIHHLFKTLDTDNDGIVDIKDLAVKYNAKLHPAVQSGKCSEETALNEFLRNFTNHHEFIMGKGADPKVTLYEFEEYYYYISAYIDEDDYFGYLVSNTWKPQETETTEEYKAPAYEPRPREANEVREPHSQDKVYEPKRIIEPEKPHKRGEDMKASNQTAAGSIKGRGELVKGNKSSQDNPLTSQSEFSSGSRTPSSKRLPELENFRKVLAIRGPGGLLGLAQQFRSIDAKSTGEIDINDFNLLIKNYKVPISEKDIRAVFEAFDKSGKWKINYHEFLMSVKGAMNQFRRKLVEMVFDSLDKQGKGIISIEDVLNAYSPLEHPLVRAKKRTGEQVLKEFIETFKMYKDLYGTESETVVTKDEFADYFNIVSATIEKDREFEQIIVDTWALHKEEMPAPYLKRQSRAGPPFGTTDEPTDYSVSSHARYKEESKAKAAGYRSDKTAVKKFPLTGGEIQVVNNFKQKLVPRGIKGILSLKKSFTTLSTGTPGLVSLQEFTQILKEQHFKYDEVNVEKLFKVFDKDRSEHINYETFIFVSIVSFYYKN